MCNQSYNMYWQGAMQASRSTRHRPAPTWLIKWVTHRYEGIAKPTPLAVVLVSVSTTEAL